MPELKNPRFEKFAQVFATTGNASEAYRQCNGRGKAVTVISTRMLANASIAARVKELQAQSVKKMTLSRDQMIANLVEMITSPPDAASLDNPLCEARYVGKFATKVAQFPERTRCMELLTKLLGWAEPDRLTISIDPLQSLLDSIRARGLEHQPIKQLESP